MLRKALPVAAAAVAALVTAGASPLQAREPAYGGIGATIAQFNAAHANSPGKPPVGTTYYRVDGTRNGRVEDYHVVVGWSSKRSTSELLARLTGRELPSDAKLVKPYNGFCAVYRSRWLGRVIGLPTIDVSAPKHAGWNGAWAGRGAGTGCKG
jgi:hypothetical protein